MLWRKVKTAKWWLLPREKRKVITAYNSDYSEKEEEKTKKKTTFENYAIPESVPKLNKIVSCDDTYSDSYKFVIYAFLFVPRLDLVCILYFFLYVIIYRCSLCCWILFLSEQRISMIILWN